MGTPDTQQARGDFVIEQRSSVKIETTAKGDPRVEVKVVEGTPATEVARLETEALNAYNRLRAELAKVAA